MGAGVADRDDSLESPFGYGILGVIWNQRFCLLALFLISLSPGSSSI